MKSKAGHRFGVQDQVILFCTSSQILKMKELAYTKKEKVHRKDVIGKITVLQVMLKGLFFSAVF